MHKRLLAAEEARVAGHILHQGLPCHQGRLRRPDSQHPHVPGCSRTGHWHHAELPTVGQARVFPSDHPSTCQTLHPSPGQTQGTAHLLPPPHCSGSWQRSSSRLPSSLTSASRWPWLMASCGRVKLQGGERAGKFLPGRVTVSLPGEVEAEPQSTAGGKEGRGLQGWWPDGAMVGPRAKAQGAPQRRDLSAWPSCHHAHSDPSRTCPLHPGLQRPQPHSPHMRRHAIHSCREHREGMLSGRNAGDLAGGQWAPAGCRLVTLP